MTGPLPRMIDKERIKELTYMGLETNVIAERLGMSTRTVYQYQINMGLRKVQNPKKKEKENEI